MFTPDLKEIYWSTQFYDENGTDTARPILSMKEIDGVWSKPEIPPFAKPFACSENPFITPDGKRLFFHASHTLSLEKADIYYVDRVGDGWSEPVNLGEPVNGPGINVQPTVSMNGTIYYAGIYENSDGLYYSKRINGKYQNPVYMEDKFNSHQTDSTPYIAPDEGYFIFCSFRAEGFGSGDLYISFKQKDGSWGKVINMGDKINTPANERFPNVTPEGKYLFFNSTKKIPGAAANAPGNGDGDVCWVDAKLISVAGKSAEGAIFTDAFFKKNPSSSSLRFVETFRNAYQRDPETLEALGYDGAKLLGEMLRSKTISSPLQLNEEISKIQNSQGISGLKGFGEGGRPLRTFSILKINKGKVELVEP